MILFRRCWYEHVLTIKPQEGQRGDVSVVLPLSREWVEDSVALSAWRVDTCIAAAGIYPVWPTRGVAWAVFAADAGKDLLTIVRQMARVIHSYPAHRVEMTVEDGFEEGHRMAMLLGFHCETPQGMPYFMPHGAKAYLYARIKP